MGRLIEFAPVAHGVCSRAHEETAMNESQRSRLSRRQVFAGAGTAGALAAVAAAVPLAGPQPQATPEAKPAPDKGGGYHVTQHVLRYYQTTKV
jgi:hypothetical protein